MNAYHTITDFGFIGDREPAKIWPLYGLPQTLTGCTVLDIGAWTGGFSLIACQKRAARVVALDKFLDSTNPTSLGPPRDAIDELKRVSGAHFEIVHHDIQLPYPGQFDVVLFLQVFYHLVNPFAGLINAAQCLVHCGQLFVETTVTDYNEQPILYYQHREASTDFWLPSIKLMEELFRSLGLTYRLTWQVPGRACWCCVRARPIRYNFLALVDDKPQPGNALL